MEAKMKLPSLLICFILTLSIFANDQVPQPGRDNFDFVCKTNNEVLDNYPVLIVYAKKYNCNHPDATQGCYALYVEDIEREHVKSMNIVRTLTPEEEQNREYNIFGQFALNSLEDIIHLVIFHEPIEYGSNKMVYRANFWFYKERKSIFSKMHCSFKDDILD